MYGKINKLYRSTGKCYNQQNYKDIIGAYLVSTPKGLTGNSTMSLILTVHVKNKVQDNHSVNFMNYCMSNRRFTYTY